MRALLLIFLLLLSSCQGQPTTKEIELYNASGDMVGTATLTEQPEGVKAKLKFEGLTPGYHGIHVHEYSKCEGPDFKSAGNHLNPEGKEHGLMNPEGAHLGDMPNVKADSDGLIEAELMIADATLLEGKKSLLKNDGTSLIISKDQDDGVSQPGGNSGQRLICGEIKADKETETEAPTDPTQIEKKKKKE